MDDLIALLRACAGTPFRKVLVCAPDVWERVKAAGCPAEPVRPFEFSVTELTGTDVIVAAGYEPGRWKLIRHDRCRVTGEETCLRSRAVTHEECTVMGEGYSLS